MADTSRLSAFAAAKARRDAASAISSTLAENVQIPGDVPAGVQGSPPDDIPSTPGAIEAVVQQEEEDNNVDSEDALNLKDATLSTWQPEGQNVLHSTATSVTVRLTNGQKLSLIGNYDLRVSTGMITLYGAELGPALESYRVYAPSTHALPVVECVSEIAAEVEISQLKHTLAPLAKLSPSYRRIWNKRSIQQGSCHNAVDRRTFSYVRQFSNHARSFFLISLSCASRQMIP